MIKGEYEIALLGSTNRSYDVLLNKSPRKEGDLVHNQMVEPIPNVLYL